MPSDIELLSVLPKISDVVKTVESIDWRSRAGIAQWLASLSEGFCGLRDLALGWYLDVSCKRSWVKSVGL